MKTFEEAFEVLAVLATPAEAAAKFDPDATQPVIESVVSIIRETTQVHLFRAWVEAYADRIVEKGDVTTNDIYGLVAGAFANGVYIGILMEKPE